MGGRWPGYGLDAKKPLNLLLQIICGCLFNRSRPGLTDNPEGCKKGKLVQEELIKEGLAKMEVYKDRGELKYEMRLVGKK